MQRHYPSPSAFFMDLESLRHSLAHLLAAAVLEHWPDSQPTIGPAIDDGFYYDFDFPTPISSNDLVKIEQTMRRILKGWDRFEPREVSPKEARKFFAHNRYKLELIDEIVGRGESLTLYTSGKFTDLCRGGHVETAKKIPSGGFKLIRLAGAYWRGDEKKPMLTRIYGLAFGSPKELEDHLAMLAEAEKRDHRKLGQTLELFTFDDLCGKGLPLWLPNGTIMRDLIEQYARQEEESGGYVRVATPHLGKEELYITSGHLPYYKDSMYPPMKMDDGTYYLKGMNCPHHHLIYKSKPRSYRDLPLRIAEYGTVYRNELSGTLAGLLRVRMLSMNDAHIYCRQDQIEEEFLRVMKLVLGYFKTFHLKEYWFRLSKWDSQHIEKYINEPKSWEYAEDVLRRVLKHLGVKCVEAADEAAFYGPKVDVMFRSAIGREETMSTIQLDFAAKERFGLTYTNRDGQKEGNVYVIHRAPLSTHERFMAFIIEHYAGAFPVWLAPVQVAVIPVGDSFLSKTRALHNFFRSQSLRSQHFEQNETVGAKVRRATCQKIPYILVVGEKEAPKGKVWLPTAKLSVRIRGQEKTTSMTLGVFLKRVRKEIENRE